MGKTGPIAPSRASWCCYCKRGPLTQAAKGAKLRPLDATRDHFVSRHERSGTGERWVPCCNTCNMLKGALRPGAWLAFIDNNPGYWRDFRNPVQVARWLIAYNAVRRSRGWRSLILYTTAPDAFMAQINRL